MIMLQVLLIAMALQGQIAQYDTSAIDNIKVESAPAQQSTVYQPVYTSGTYGSGYNLNVIKNNQNNNLEVIRNDFHIQANTRQYQDNTQVYPEKAAIGVHFSIPGNRIEIIDPNSDLFGKADIGDYLVADDGIPNMTYMSSNMSRGPAGTVIVVTIHTKHGQTYTVPVARKPISSFGPYFQSVLSY